MRVIAGRNVSGLDGDCLAVCIYDRGWNSEGRNGSEGSVSIHDVLRKTWNLVRRARAVGAGVETVRAGVGCEIEIEGAVFLEEYKDVFDAAANELQFLFL